MAQVSLAVDGIAKAFGETLAVRQLSLEAAPGEVIGLLGPNGAGKTTAIRVLTTIYPPDSGSFGIDGIPYTRPSAIRQRIGVLPESAGYPLHQSGDEFVQFFARLFGHSRISARETAKTLLAEVGLGDRAASPISTYSRGMRQRLGVARALVNAPCVLFLDEPTLGLDPAGQRQILALIREVAGERRTTVILSTHFLDEVEEVCSRVIILNRGEVIAEGQVAEIKRRAGPRTASVRVPEEMHESALSVLSQLPGVASARAINGGGLLHATLHGGDASAKAGNTVPHALIEAGIPVLSFEVEGGKLSDAFLALTREAGE